MGSIIIVGAGIAGFSAGIFAQKANFDTIIFEKNAEAGGLCSGWYRKNCLIDGCIHWLIGTKKGTPLYKMWTDLGVIDDDLEIIHPEILYTSELDNQKITFWNDIDKTRSEMIALSPQDKEEINRLLDVIKKPDSFHVPIDIPPDMVEPQQLVSKYKSMWNMGKEDEAYSQINISDLSERFKHPLLKTAISDFLADEYAAMFLINSYSSFVARDGGIPKGGSREVVRRLEAKYKFHGGTLKVGCGVKNIVLGDNGRAIGVRLSNDEFVSSDYVICACDTHHVFRQLLNESFMNRKMRHAYCKQEMYPVCSGFHTALTVEGEISEIPRALVFGCRLIKIACSSFNRMGIANYAYEKSFAPEGKALIQISFPQYYDDFLYWNNLRLDIAAYKSEKAVLANGLTERLVERFPQYAGKVEIVDVWTPVTYNRICNCYNGSYSGYMMANHESSMFLSGRIKNLDNVFLASQWLMVPGGIPAAAAMGKFAVQWILKAENRSIYID